MKMIKGYMRHEKLEAVRLKLFELGVPGLPVYEIKGIGKPLSSRRADTFANWYLAVGYIFKYKRVAF